MGRIVAIENTLKCTLSRAMAVGCINSASNCAFAHQSFFSAFVQEL